jgi:PPOX class probable F420-dependent enzyme
MTRSQLVDFLRRYRYGVVATLGPGGEPQSAVVGLAVSDGLELVFDTIEWSRKAQNLRRDPRASLVVGWDEEQTVQIEGLADVLAGPERDRLLAVYLAAFPDGRDRLAWPGIVHVRLRPTWARYSDFRGAAPAIEEVPL